MSIFDRIFKKRQQPQKATMPKLQPVQPKEMEEATMEVESSNEFKVILKTKKNLSEEQKNTIITIVRDGIISDVELRDICIHVMMSTGIYDTIILSRISNGVEIII